MYNTDTYIYVCKYVSIMSVFRRGIAYAFAKRIRTEESKENIRGFAELQHIGENILYFNRKNNGEKDFCSYPVGCRASLHI